MINNIHQSDLALIHGGISVSYLMERSREFVTIVSMLHDPENLSERFIHQIGLAVTASFALTGLATSAFAGMIKYLTRRNVTSYTKTSVAELKKREQDLNALEKDLEAIKL